MRRNRVEWDSAVCHNGTVRRRVRLVTLLLAAAAAFAQSPNWRQVGGFGVDAALASPATGPVDQVWFSNTGSVLFARTHSGHVFQTADFENWLPADNSTDKANDPPRPVAAAAARMPESGAHIIQAPGNPARIYALGRHLFRSDD